jgi:hypothetical protein
MAWVLSAPCATCLNDLGLISLCQRAPLPQGRHCDSVAWPWKLLPRQRYRGHGRKPHTWQGTGGVRMEADYSSNGSRVARSYWGWPCWVMSSWKAKIYALPSNQLTSSRAHCKTSGKRSVSRGSPWRTLLRDMICVVPGEAPSRESLVWVAYSRQGPKEGRSQGHDHKV